MGKRVDATSCILLTETDRGFALVEFKDRYGNECSLQKSSLATEDCCWLGVSTDHNGVHLNARMHLTQAQVKALLPFLECFVETGELYEEGK